MKHIEIILREHVHHQQEEGEEEAVEVSSKVGHICNGGIRGAHPADKVDEHVEAEDPAGAHEDDVHEEGEEHHHHLHA